MTNIKDHVKCSFSTNVIKYIFTIEYTHVKREFNYLIVKSMFSFTFFLRRFKL